jgi:Cu2+-exporting ATPase
VPAVLVASVGTAAAWWLVDPSRAFWVALSVLVITCPCALSLATPAALTAASGGALRRGLLLRTGSALETLQRVTHVVFDKTGTLTLGRFRLRATQPLGAASVAECLAAATALERYSEHPVARAFDDPGAAPVEVRDVSARVGAGVEGTIGGRRLRIGTRRFAEELSLGHEGHPSHAAAVRHSFAARHLGSAEHDELPGVWLGDELELLCRFELEDETRPLAAATISRLRRAGLRVSVVSGDAAPSVGALAARLGIEDARASCTPEDKLAHVRGLQQAGHVVLMVGDGVNDAPVLGAAQVSIAMGGGTDLARSCADAVLLKEDLGPVADAIEVARAARRVMRQNLAWSLTYNVVALPLACAGLVTPWWAAIGMSLSSLVVVLNAVRLGRPAGAKPGRSGSTTKPLEAGDEFEDEIGRVGHRMAA